MAHKKINDKVVVDWTTGDPEGDRLTLLAAYRDFIQEIQTARNDALSAEHFGQKIDEIFERWKIDTENQIDEVPRIWISRPE